MAAPIGVALIGSGIYAKNEHLPAILSTPNLSLKAVYSRTLESAATLTSGLDTKCDWYSDETAQEGRGFNDLLLNTNIRAVIIALPITVQPQFIKAALVAGKHVLSEKPIAKDVSTAQELINDAEAAAKTQRSTWSIAENYRFFDSHKLGREKISSLGRLLGFRVRVQSMVKPGGKYFETAWRKVPEYQGGFLLDGGVHYVASLRYFLGPENALTKVTAFTHQLQDHLPPVDTVNAIFQTQSGISGTFAVSFGTTFKGTGYSFACENGTVTIMRGKVIVEVDGAEETFNFPNEGAGVKQEMAIWAQSIQKNEFDSRLSPHEAIADLIVLEALLRSGETGGQVKDIHT